MDKSILGDSYSSIKKNLEQSEYNPNSFKNGGYSVKATTRGKPWESIWGGNLYATYGGKEYELTYLQTWRPSTSASSKMSNIKEGEFFVYNGQLYQKAGEGWRQFTQKGDANAFIEAINKSK